MKKQILMMAFAISSLAANAQTLPAGVPTGANNLVGYGKLANVTGGKGGQVVTVTDWAGLKAAAAYAAAPNLNKEPRIILVQGIIAPPPMANGRNEQLNVASNKTIIGKPGSELQGIQIFLKNKESNIILRNLVLKFTTTVSTSQDLISFDDAKNVWIDHCDFLNPNNLTAIQTDGFTDVRAICDSITLSWNYFHPHTVSGFQNDASKKSLTAHHNRFENVPDALIFRGSAMTTDSAKSFPDIFNNYFQDITIPAGTGTPQILGISGNTCARVLGNVFENTSRGEGIISVATGSGIDATAGANSFTGTTAGTPPANSCTFSSTTGYTATIPAGLIQSADAVKVSVIAYAGAKITDASILRGEEQDPTAVEEELAFNTGKFYPNPFTNEFNISLSKSFNYEVVDLTGRTLEVGSASGEVAVGQSVPSGIYFVKISMGNALRVVRASKK